SVTHFLVKLVLAAPFSFWSFAEASQVLPASLWHFFMKLFSAAPASFLSVAWLLQVSAANAVVANDAIKSPKKICLMPVSLWLSPHPQIQAAEAGLGPARRRTLTQNK